MSWKTRVAASVAAATAALLVAGGLAASPALAATTAPVIKGSLHPVAVAVNSTGKTAYVVDANGFVNIVTTSTKKVAHQITTFSTAETSGFLGGGALSANGSTLWVSNYDGPGGTKLLAYSTSSRHLLHNFSLGGATAGAVTITPDGSTGLVWGTTTGAPARDALFEVNLTSGALLTVDLGNAPATQNATAIAVSSDSSTAYVTTATGVAQVTLADSDVANIATVGEPEGIALASDNSTLYIAESGGVIEKHTSDGTVTFGSEADTQLTSTALNPLGTDLLVTGAGTTSSLGKAWVFSTATGDELSEDIVGTDPYASAINAQGTAAYVANNATGTVSILTLKATKPAITNHTPPAGTVGVGYTTTWAATGYPSPTYTSTGTLPAGLTLDKISGALTGSPTTAGAFKFTIVASNASGKSATSKTETVTIKRELTPGTPDVTGTIGTGNTLAVDPGSWGPGTVKISYQWQRSTNGGGSWKSISKATKAGYKVPSSYKNDEFRVIVTGKESGYTTATAIGYVQVIL